MYKNFWKLKKKLCVFTSFFFVLYFCSACSIDETVIQQDVISSEIHEGTIQDNSIDANQNNIPVQKVEKGETDEAIGEKSTEMEQVIDEVIAEWPYWVEEKVYAVEHNNVSIEFFFPALHGFEDAQKEEKINLLIENECKRLIPNTLEVEQQENEIVCTYLDYEIKFMNHNVVSIFYKGMNGCMVSGHGLDAAAMATTINLETMEVITLSDIITDFDELHSLLLQDHFDNITVWEGKTGANTIIREYGGLLEEWLLEALKSISEENSCIEWYTDGENIVIVSVLSDYNEYSASIDSLQELIKEEFQVKLIE